MCGIAGFLDPQLNVGRDTLNALAGAMADAIAHRGPDDAGVWSDPDAGIALGHRRLSIIDLSVDGHQPMASRSGRYVVVFNGEIYNYAAIRAELDGASPMAWRGHSDTEVMLQAFERWGIDGAISRFNGMFAFALWDRDARVLHLVRDRMGEKPLYFGFIGGRFAFASELKALRTLPGFKSRIDNDAVALFLRLGYVPAPRSIYAGIEKLPAATRAEIPWDASSPGEIRRRVYWDLDGVARRGSASPTSNDRAAACAELRERLVQSIRQRMVADVPLGAFLSGGIDSSLIVALMQSVSPTPVRTFTIGFDNRDFDEAPHARAVARHLGTQHTEDYVTGQQALAVVPRLASIYDEPFADASQIPTFLMCQIARKQVTVCLSGDGGDELFAGYERYVRTMRIAAFPSAGRRAAAAVLKHMSPASAGAMANWLLPRRLRFAHAADKIAKLQGALGGEDALAIYERVISQWRGEPVPVRSSGAAARPGFLASRFPPAVSLDAWMMLVDQSTWLPDDILVKLDRAAMAVGLEARVPFLDHTLVEYAWRVSPALKLHDGRGKSLLRSLLADLVPPALTERPKRGFAIPLAEWLRGPLRDWAEALIDEQLLRQQGLLDATRVRNRWSEHIRGVRNAHDELWSVLTLQAWLADTR